MFIAIYAFDTLVHLSTSSVAETMTHLPRPYESYTIWVDEFDRIRANDSGSNFPVLGDKKCVKMITIGGRTNMATEKQQVKTKFYKVLRTLDEKDKCPPQMKLILDTVAAAGGRIERTALITFLKRPPEQGGLKTNQTAERILGFYRPKFKDMGLMIEEVETTEVEVEVPDKPAKPAKPAKSTKSDAAAGEPAASVAPAKPAKGTKKSA